MVGPDEIVELQGLVRRRWPSGRHPGGLAWELATRREPPVLERFRDAGGSLRGWAIVDQPDTVSVEAEADVAADALAWALDEARGPRVEVLAATDDRALRAALTAAGLTPHAPWSGMFRDASTADRPDLDAGCVVRSSRPEEDEARVAVHRSAWRPADLPWHPDHRPQTDPDATSSFTLESLRRVRASPLHDADLDLVVEAPGGGLVASCLVWFDADLGVAEIEPLGVVPSHRRLGLAGALCLEASARVAERGGSEVFINVGPRPEYPASAGAYSKAGFEYRRRGDVWVRDR